MKVRTGGYSPRPGRLQRPVDQVKFLDRRLKSGWEAVRGGRAHMRAADLWGTSVTGGPRPASSLPVFPPVPSVVRRQPRSPCPKRQEDPGSVHRNRRRAGRDHRRRDPRRRLSLPPARPRGHRGGTARRLHRRQRRLPDRRRPRGRRVHRRRDGGDPEPLQPGRPHHRLPRQPGTPHRRRRPPRRAHRAGPRRRHRRDPGAQALRALGDRQDLTACRPRPLRRGEGLHHRRRHQPHRRRRRPRLLHRQPHPHHPRPDHARHQAARRPGQPRGGRHRQVRRAAARHPGGTR